MKISYAITVCDEFLEIQRLVTLLINNKRPIDEIVVLVDLTKNKPTSELLGYLHKLSAKNHITLLKDQFDGHFSDWKNRLTRVCKGDYIVNIDADEIPHLTLLENLPEILESNPVDLIRVCRVNTVEGLTDEHIKKWRWNVDSKGWVNWPDKQSRIYKNDLKLKWEGNVHERITGYKTFAELPEEELYSFYHPKSIEKQVKQNNYYDTL
jgi:hypothetical protein